MLLIDRTIKDGDVILTIRKYLISGSMIDEKYEDLAVGIPQDGNLSPVLANIILKLDKETDKRGLNFVRYADGCIIMVRREMSAN